MSRLFKYSSSILLTLKDFIKKSEIEKLVKMARLDLENQSIPIVHTSDTSGEDISSQYIPAGRSLSTASKGLSNNLSRALDRYMPELGMWLPKVGASPWLVMEYQEGQYVIPHADGSKYLADERSQQLAALSVWLDIPSQGGEFYVQTETCNNDWNIAGTTTDREGIDKFSSRYDYSAMPKWKLTGLTPGDAVLFGAEVIHGTSPVKCGRALKAMCFLTNPKSS